MSVWNGPRIALILIASALLAACATQPRQTASPPVVTARPSPPAPTVAPIREPEPRNEPWTGMIARFALDDCADSTLIHGKAKRYTRNPVHFEEQLQQAMPLLLYVDDELARAGVPAEFSLLPMVESEFRPSEPSRHGDPAGMWQLMPRTARAHGVVINRHYDGRLDPVASTAAAAEMLKSLGETFGDWRLADMAYNAGKYKILRVLRNHPDASTDAPIPKLPVSAITRNHLAKLMALACIIRKPQRFNVELPVASASDRLATTQVPSGTALTDAARMAGVPLVKLHALNPGYHGRSVPADSPRTLLLPAAGALALASALAVEPGVTLAQTDPPSHSVDPASSADPPPHHSADRYQVRRGDTLWSIATRFHISVDQLKQWNDLGETILHPGQSLQIGTGK